MASSPTGPRKGKEGYLKKEGGKRKSWRRRWCVLQPANGTLFYHTKQAGQLKGKISLKYCGEIRPEKYKNKKYAFTIQTPERSWHIQADSDAEMMSWIEALKSVRDYFKGVESPSSADNLGSSSSPSTNRLGVGSTPTGGSASKPLPNPGGASNSPNANRPSNSALIAGGDPGRISEDSFLKMKVIGRGSFGKVFKVQKKDSGAIFAMKVLNKSEVAERNEVTHARAENSILRKLDCPFLVKMHYAFQSNDKLYFVMDFINGGELFFHLQKEGRFSEDRVKFYVAEIVLGLEYLHAKGIIYRDLKPENLLLSAEGHIVMTDFGISKEGLGSGSANESGKTSTFCGTPEYLAPEVLKQEKYTKAVDWWSLGTLMYEMLSGLPPFYSEEVQNMYYNIINTQLVMPKGTNSETQSLLTGFLAKNPNDRLSEPEKIKSHPFFKGIDWEKLYAKQVKPPYVPPVKSLMDDSQISPEFTDDSIEDESGKTNASAAKPIHFDGFTFVGGK